MENVSWFEPNDRTHPAFGAALRHAAEAGVEVLAMECRVTPEELLPGPAGAGAAVSLGGNKNNGIKTAPATVCPRRELS